MVPNWKTSFKDQQPLVCKHGVYNPEKFDIKLLLFLTWFESEINKRSPVVGIYNSPAELHDISYFDDLLKTQLELMLRDCKFFHKFIIIPDNKVDLHP